MTRATFDSTTGVIKCTRILQTYEYFDAVFILIDHTHELGDTPVVVPAYLARLLGW
jgi:hypothetical protein